MKSADHCPNCRREFYPFRWGVGEYCPECWAAWMRDDDLASFKARTVSIKQFYADEIKKGGEA